MANELERLREALADRYRLERELGHGGMATVHLAEDVKHHRPVAIKVLRPELTQALGPERFLREIELTARLTHPHILSLHDSGEAAGFLYYVMPYVEGESLRDRLTREKQLPVDDALQIAGEVADALSYAHKHGVIHRDIKPENILLHTGHAVVADFGIARAIAAAGGDTLTATGIAIGTPPYMSPEQAGGSKDLDGRSDLYSLGCVLHEMLAGQPPFTGPTAESVLHQHLAAEPPSIRTLRPAVPAWVAAALTRALAKIPADRFSTVALFAQAMSPRASLTDAPVGSGHPRWTTAVAISVVGLVAGLGLLIGWRLLTDQGGAIAVVRTTRLATEQGMAFDPALSPDGRLLAYAGGDLQRGTGIYVRQIGGGGAISLAAGRGTRWPRWSRDGAWIAYESAGEIYVISALGGASRRLTQGAFPAWSQDGRRLVFIRGDTLFSLDLEASTPKALTTAFEPSSPAWSPDGSRIAYVVGNENYRDGNVIPSALWILDLATGTAAPVTDSEYVNQSPVWAGDGRALLYVSNRDGSNDVYRLALGRSGAPSGRPRRLTIGAGAWTISATPDGELVAYSVLGESTDIWAFPLRSRPGPTHLSDGRQVTRVGDLSFFDVSPDGMWLAWNAPNGIYKEDMVNGDVTLLADGGKVPSWSPDGREIAFYRFRDGNRDIFVMSADGRNQLALTRSVAQEYAPDWSPDGRSLVFSSTVGHGSAPTELYVVSRPQPNTTAWGAPRKVSADGSWAARWSPDGRFIAYARRRRGGVAPSVAEIGVVTPDGTRDRVLVRVPIREPHPDWIEWSPDSRSVYYLATDAEGAVSLWAAPVAPGAPRRLMSFDRDLDLPPCFDLHGNTVYVSVERTAGHISLVELSRGR